MKLSICNSCLDKSLVDINGFYFGVLSLIANKDTVYSVVNDSDGEIFDTYKESLFQDNSGLLSYWFEAIAANDKIVKVNNNEDLSDNIYLNTLANTFGSRAWLTDSASSYNEYKHTITDHCINFLHADEASKCLNRGFITNVFDYQQLTSHLVNQLSIMMDRKHTVRLEDLHNDELTTSLEQHGYFPSDQTRRGTTGTQGNPGELDILVKSNSNIKVSIIEALRESSCGEGNRNISAHLNKLLNDYDTCGLKVNYIIVYCEAVNFGLFWDNYIAYMADINNKPDFSSDIPQTSFIDTDDEISPFSEVRVARGIHNRSNRSLEVYHIVCNMYVRN